MYKVFRDNKLYSKHQDLLEAKMDAILVHKKNPKSLLEVFDDSDVVVFNSNPKEPTEEEKKAAKDTLVRDLITKCYNSINDYESAKISLSSSDVDYDDRTETIFNDIIDDLNMHIGSLTSLLSDYDKVIGSEEENGL